ncbi:MAG: hypothetical protein ACTSQF_01020 [Candidatus Heimdallarchaeaceae archaeon]
MITTEAGVPIFDFQEFARGDEVLVSGLITAILRFIEETEKDTLSRLLLEESQFLISSKETLIFIFQIDDEMPADYAEYVSNFISESFIERFRREIEEFAGNVSLFQEFQIQCKNILLQCGIEIADSLMENKDSQDLRAWCLFSNENEPLIVHANSPNYNIDSFTIYQILGKSFRRVASKLKDCTKGTCFHITHLGNSIQTIVLPKVFFVLESKIDEFEVKRFKQFKIKTSQQLLDYFNKVYKPNRIDIFNKDGISTATNSEMSDNYKLIADLFKAAEKGFQYLFNTPIHIQILCTSNNCFLHVKLINRTIIMEYTNEISISDLLESTRKMFEVEAMLTDDSPELVLEKS